MNVVDMHFDFKVKMNRVSSSTFLNYRIPEIDRLLNDAMYIFIKKNLFPRSKYDNNIDTSQRNIDDIRPLVTQAKNIGIKDNNIPYPSDYMFFLNGNVMAIKLGDNKYLRLIKHRHIDRFKDNTLYDGSYEWGEVAGVFQQDGIKLFGDNSFSNITCDMSYVRKPKYIHNASGMGGYALGDGTSLGGRQDCELPEHTHVEIVDIATMIAKGIVSQDGGYEASVQRVQLDSA